MCVYVCVRARVWVTKQANKEQTPWPESAGELYRPNDRRLSAKLLQTFADKEV
jgi:hypothetical protein